MPFESSSPVPPRAQSALLDLYRRALDGTEPELYQTAIEAAVAVTGSEIGYLHLVNDDQETIELGTWSAGTLHQCSATYERHYPLSAAGVWADCARTHRPQVHNDFQHVAHRHGYPEGHAHLVRHLGVPVLEGGRVRLLVGVGNKAADYGADDVECVQAIASHAWHLIRHYRQKLALALSDRQLRELQGLAAISLWSWDPAEGRLTFDAHLRRILGLAAAQATTFDLDGFLKLVDTRDHTVLIDALRAPTLDAAFEFDLRATRGDTLPVVLHFRGSAYPRSQGHGLVLRGVAQDVTERRDLARARPHNGHDPLTGLATRNALLLALERRLTGAQAGAEQAFAVHAINLNRFKPVNDAFGHAVGDRVLRIVAERLVHSVHKGDLVARLGGDEFAVLEHRATRGTAVAALAGRLVATLEAPIEVDGLVIEVGASIGVAVAHPGGDQKAAALLGQAEAAMAQARRTGRGGFCLA